VAGVPDIGRDLDSETGKHFDLRCAEAANGQVVVRECTQHPPRPRTSRYFCMENSPGNRYLVTPDGTQCRIVQYNSYQDAMQRQDGREHNQVLNASQVVAYEVGFAALTSAGAVWTWGDPRYVNCLGRNASNGT
jgi:hypothetical protein